jgi:hypothetical protein
VVIVIGYAAAVLFFFARTLGTWPRSIAFVLLGVLVLGGAPMTGQGAVAVRSAVAMALVISILHMWDLHVDPERASRLRLKNYAVWLLDYGWGVARAAGCYGVELSWKQRGLDAGRYVVGLCLVSVLVFGVFRVDWHRYPFWFEHAAKSICLGTWLVWAFNANTALWRLAGAPAALFTEKNVLGARSPPEFWRRWNRPMYRWFVDDVYRPLGGRRYPYLAGMAPFVVSGLLHEYLFAATFHRVTGYITLFFLLQGVAALLTRRVKPTGSLAVAALLLTLAFNTFSSVLLFLPIHERIPFYVNDVPRWLHLW